MEPRDLNRMFDALAPTADQEQAVLDRLLQTERKGKPMRKLKKLTVFAVAAALMVISVAAANPEGMQEFFNNIASVVQMDQYRSDWTTPTGETVAVYQIPHPSVENRNGRAILVIDGKDAADITDALRSEGRYAYDLETEEGQLHILVEGTAEEWTASVMIGELGDRKYLYTMTNRSDGSGEASAPGWSVPDDSEGNEDAPIEDLTPAE